MGTMCTHLAELSKDDNTFSVPVLVERTWKKALNIIEHNAFIEVERRLGL